MSKLHFGACLAAVAFAFLMLIPGPLAAQKPDSPPPAAPEGDVAEGTVDDPAGTFKSNVEVVQLFFNVKDKHGALIPSLTKDSFDIAEDGKPQTIKYFK